MQVYYYTSVKASSPDTWLDFGNYGLTLDLRTGVISGTPTKFMPRTDVIIKAYHVESGTWLSYQFDKAIATNFDVEGRMLSYPYSDDITYEQLRLTVSDASIFSTCSKFTCFTTSSGVKGYIRHIDLERNLLFVEVKTSDRLASKDWSKKTISVGDNIENGNDFIASSSTISEVVRTVDLNSLVKEYNPYFNFDLDRQSEEWKDLRWSISPLPPGGLQNGSQTEEPFHLVYKDDTKASNIGTLYWGGQEMSMAPKEYTISVKNSIGQILQTKIMINFERAPEGSAVSNFALIRVDNYEKIYVGDYISTVDEDVARVYHKAYAEVDSTAEDPEYKYYLMVKLLKGDFEPDQQIDHFKITRAVAKVMSKPELVNNVITTSTGSFKYDDKGELANRYVSFGLMESKKQNLSLHLS